MPQKNQLTTSGAAGMAEKTKLSSVAKKGVLEVDMPPGENLMRDTLAKILLIFENILPRHGYALREKQKELAAHILEALGRRCVTLAEAEPYGKASTCPAISSLCSSSSNYPLPFPIRSANMSGCCIPI